MILLYDVGINYFININLTTTEKKVRGHVADAKVMLTGFP